MKFEVDKLKKRGLQFNLWVYFTSFSLIILMILWLLQVILFNTYYETMKINEAENLGNEIAQNFTSGNVPDILPHGEFRHGMIIRSVSLDGELKYNDLGRNELRPRERIEREKILKYIEKLNNSSKKHIVEISANNFIGIDKNVVYMSKVYDSNGKLHSYLYIQTPLTPTDATVNVLKSQLLMVSVLIIFISFLLSFFLAKKLSKPVIEIKNSSLELAKGNYNVHFNDGGYKEISELSNVLNNTAYELKKNEMLRRDLIANVSHDLKTPLTIIKSYAEMIIDISGDNKGKREEHLGVIIKESDRLTELVNDILDLSKIEAKIEKFEMKEFDIADTLRRVYEKFQVFSECKKINFNLICPDSLMAIGNEVRINQVMYNLIGNAVNYTGPDNFVEVKLFEKEETVRFEVRDTGEGISEEDKERVWDMYYKTSKNNTREQTGSGIGLAIVKNVLINHNAFYGVESELGKGSTFYFELKKAVKK